MDYHYICIDPFLRVHIHWNSFILLLLGLQTLYVTGLSSDLQKVCWHTFSKTGLNWVINLHRSFNSLLSRILDSRYRRSFVSLPNPIGSLSICEDLSIGSRSSEYHSVYEDNIQFFSLVNLQLNINFRSIKSTS